EGGDATPRQPEAHRQPFGGGDPDPQAGERTRPEPDRDQVDGRPAARRLGAALDLGEQPGRVARAAALVQPELGLGQDLAVAPGAGGGVGGRGVETDDDQRDRLLLHTKDGGPDFLAFDEPGDLVAADARRGDLVDVERPLFSFLRFFGAEMFSFRELDADRVFDVALQAFEEGALFAADRADV